MSNDNISFNNVVIASGPVIIKDNKVLLNKHGESQLWKFPGGDITEPEGNLEAWAERKVKEEMGLEVKIIRPLKPMILWRDDEVVILIHYLAELKSEKIKPAYYIKEHALLDIDNLPADCSPNIKPVIEEYKRTTA